MTSEIIYNGNLRTTMTHTLSGSEVITDAPIDNQGNGAHFSPTDLVATALGSCMLTIMGISARTQGWNIDGTHCTVEKIMTPAPRRIGVINITLYMKGLDNYNEKQRVVLEKSALTCPVYLSLHPDVEKNIKFVWSNEKGM